MKIYYVDSGRDEFVFIKQDSSLLMIVGYDNYGTDKYNFKTAKFIFFKNQELNKNYENITDITDIFWSYVPDKDERWLKQKLIKTIFD